MANTNKGIIFENNFFNAMQGKKQGVPVKISKFLSEFLAYTGPIATIKSVGGENSKRPIMKDNLGLYVSQKGSKRIHDIGKTISDITISRKSKLDIYLSLKSTSTVTFFNSGIMKFFTKEDIESEKIKTPIGKELLELFGLEEKKFCQIFNNYGKKKSNKNINPTPIWEMKATNKKQISQNDRLKKLTNFTKSIIGYGYELLHEQNNGDIHWKTMDKQAMNNASKITRIEIFYGGQSGEGKRIDIIALTPTYSLKFNIRSKNGGILPTHIMCDYKER